MTSDPTPTVALALGSLRTYIQGYRHKEQAGVIDFGPLRDIEAVLAAAEALRVLAALSTTPAPLDAAWAAAEAALPEGWHIASMASDGPENPGWYVDARSAMVGGQRIAASGPTAAAALLALAEKLREYAKP